MADDVQAHPTDAVLRRVPTQQRARQKVDRALDAAESLLNSEGVEAITLPRVAQEADVSVGALYQYLPDRDAIVEALSAVYYARLESLMDELVEDLISEPVEDPVGEVMRSMVQLYRNAAGTRAMRAAFQGSGQLAIAREHKLRMVGKVDALLKAYGVVDPNGSDTVARTLFFAADGVMHEAFADEDMGRSEMLAELEAMLRAYLRVAR